MQKAYSRTYWENYPSDKTAVNEENLNKMETGLDEIDDRVITLDTTKATKVEVSPLFSEVAFDEGTGVITFTRKNGAVVTIDTKLEKLAVNFAYDPETEQLIITLDDGGKQYVDLSALITQYEFLDSDTIGFQVQADGSVKAVVLNGSITEDKLQPNYLADIKIETAKAEASSAAAATSETNAKASETAAKESQTAAKASETNAETYAENAKKSETNAASSAGASADSAAAAKASETNASDSETAANTSKTQAATSAKNAADSAATATQKASDAGTFAEKAAGSAAEAESYARGGTGTREGEDTDNAMYYYEQAKHISQGGNGLVPMGTITFEQLPTADITVNAMYNISNAFTSDERFQDGGGISYGAGNNAYYTVDGKWDVLASSGVTGVKGGAETSYRQGNVNITKANIGLGNVPNVSTNNQTPTYTEAETLTELTSGEKLSVAFGKLKLAVKNVINIVKLLGTTDISSLGDGTVTGAISSITGFTSLFMESTSEITDCDNLPIGCTGYTYSSTAHAPDTQAGWYVFCIGLTPYYKCQIAANSKNAAFRTRYASGWGEWGNIDFSAMATLSGNWEFRNITSEIVTADLPTGVELVGAIEKGIIMLNVKVKNTAMSGNYEIILPDEYGTRMELYFANSSMVNTQCVARVLGSKLLIDIPNTFTATWMSITYPKRG